MMLSTVATSSIEDALAARGGHVWQQLYPTNVWEVTRAIIKRAEAAGSPAIVLTVDLQEGSNRETLFRAERVDKRECSACHQSAYTGDARGRGRGGTGSFAQYAARKPMLDGLDLSKVTVAQPANMDWDFVKRLRDTVTVKLLLKGIVTREDAQLAVEHGVDALIVSNHGGRAEDGGDRGRSEENSRHCGRRRPARHGYLQSPRVRRVFRGNRPAPRLGLGRLRPTRR